MKLASLSILVGLATALPTSPPDQYEYIIIGSGPGGGTLAANLARAGHSVFLIEAGGDQGNTPLQRIPAMADQVAEHPSMSWSFYVNHYQNETQARRDSKYAYRLSNGTLWSGIDPPEGSEPLGILYPRGATLGGSAQLNAMNFALPPDNDWDAIAELTGDESWMSDKMRELFIDIENCTYAPEGTAGHGFDGFIQSNCNNISYIAAPAFIICNGLTKSSLLTFYLQVSPQRWFRRAIFATIAFVVLYTIIIASLLLFGCQPGETAWNPYLFASGKCIDYAVMYIIIAVANIISDIVLFAIPMPMIVRLKMPLGQKIGLGIVLGIATITVTTSIIRMIYLPSLLGALDIPWIAAPANVWSFVEVNLFIICGCMPTFRKFFKRFAPKWMGSSSDSGSSEPPSYDSPHKVQRKKHTGYSQFDTCGSMELATYPATVSRTTQITTRSIYSGVMGNRLDNASEEAILQPTKIVCTKTYDVSHSE